MALRQPALRNWIIALSLTWYVSAVLGVYETAMAPPEMRFRTASGPASGIVMGAAGTALGAGVGAGIIVVLVACTPGVVVLAASIAAGSYFGYQGFEIGKSGGESLFDWISELDLEPLRRAALTVLR